MYQPNNSIKMATDTRSILILVVVLFTQMWVSTPILLYGPGAVNSSLTLLEQKMTAMEARMESLESSCRCVESRPVFMAGLAHTLTKCTTGQRVVFDLIHVNKEQAYNNRYGFFRAPIAGQYAFSLTVSTSAAKYTQLSIVQNSTSNAIGYIHAHTGTSWAERSTTVFSHLNVGDEVWVNCMTESHIEGGGFSTGLHSHFSGFLVSAD